MCLPQRRFDKNEQPLDAAAIRLDDVLADGTDASAFSGLAEQALQRSRQLFRAGQLQGRAAAQQQQCNFFAVEMRWSRQHRQAQRRRLEQVVPADRHQAAADEGHVGGRVQRHEFSDRVHQQHLRVDRQSRCSRAVRHVDAAREFDAAARQQISDGGEAILVARRQ